MNRVLELFLSSMIILLTILIQVYLLFFPMKNIGSEYIELYGEIQEILLRDGEIECSEFKGYGFRLVINGVEVFKCNWVEGNNNTIYRYPIYYNGSIGVLECQERG